MEKLGIIGGMGPAATARLFSRVIDFTNASCDQEHLDITVLNIPTVPDRTAFLLGQPGAKSFVPVLQDAALRLEAIGCTKLIMPCNTAHAKLDEIQSVLSTATFVSMLESAACAVEAKGCKRVGVLGTDGTLAAGVYARTIVAHGMQAVRPDEDFQKLVMAVIYDYVKAGQPVPVGTMESIFSHMKSRKCDGIILGCTELSVLPTPSVFCGMHIVDALDELSKACILACGGTVRE